MIWMICQWYVSDLSEVCHITSSRTALTLWRHKTELVGDMVKQQCQLWRWHSRYHSHSHSVRFHVLFSFNIHNSTRVPRSSTREGRKSWNLLAIKIQGTNRSGKGGEEAAMWPRIWVTTRRERKRRANIRNGIKVTFIVQFKCTLLFLRSRYRDSGNIYVPWNSLITWSALSLITRRWWTSLSVSNWAAYAMQGMQTNMQDTGMEKANGTPYCVVGVWFQYCEKDFLTKLP